MSPDFQGHFQDSIPGMANAGHSFFFCYLFVIVLIWMVFYSRRTSVTRSYVLEGLGTGNNITNLLVIKCYEDLNP